MNSYADYFPASSWYAGDVVDPNPLMVREGSGRGRVFGYTERHLHAVWFDPHWRPKELVTASGERVEVEYPGRWNLEAGPDFLGAALLVGPDRRRIEGDVEIHVFPSDWRSHRHESDPRYRHVCAHVTYFEGLLDDHELPPGTLQVALRPALKGNPLFAFEHLDVTAYPYAGRADEPPCRAVFSRWPVEDRATLLVSAGQARMRLKADRFAMAIAEQGSDQVLYEMVLGAIGYQHNKRPFQSLASLLPVELLRRLSGGDVVRAYALLSGMSGLLPAGVAPSWDEETRQFIRALWDIWWKERSGLPSPLPVGAWRLSGVRPLNHPLRRMMAAARVFAGPQPGHEKLACWLRPSVRETLAALTADLGGLDTPYWPYRDSLGGKPRPKPAALLGPDRLEVILVNIILPMAAALGISRESVIECAAAARPEAINQIMRQTASYLLGPDHPSSLMGTASQRQGLMQIFHDHCLHDRSRCTRCTFPAWLEKNRRQP